MGSLPTATIFGAILSADFSNHCILADHLTDDRQALDLYRLFQVGGYYRTAQESKLNTDEPEH